MTTWWLRAAGACAAVFVSALALGSCSLGFELDREQCEKTADCSSFGAAECIDKVCVAITNVGGSNEGGSNEGGSGGSPPIDPKWECLGNVVPPDPGGDTVLHVYRFVLAVDESAVPMNLSTQVCVGIDPTCASPLSGFPQPDSTGRLELELGVDDLDIFLKVTSDETMPTTVFLQTPIIIPQTEKIIRMVSQETLAALAISAADEEYDPTKSTSVVLTSNCVDERTAGVHIESAAAVNGTLPFYFQGGIPNPDVTETDEQGAGGFLNMPPGPATVMLYRGSTDEYIGSGTFIAQAGVLSYIPIGPTAAE